MSVFLTRAALACCTIFFTFVFGIACLFIGWPAALLALLLLGLLLLLRRSILRLQPTVADRLCGLLYGAFCLLLATCGYLLEVVPAWDFCWVYLGALDLTTSHQITWTSEYFLESINNLFPAMLEAPVLLIGSKLGIQPPYSLAIGNVILIAVAVLFFVRGLRWIGGSQYALLGMLLCATCFPLYLYAPIYYTDTFSLPVVALLFYLAARCRSCLSAGPASAKLAGHPYLAAVLCGALGAIGYKIKPTALIFLLALLLAALLYSPRQAVRPVLLCLAVCMALLAAYSLWLPRSGIIDLSGLAARQLPPLHYVMMGLHGNGGYYEPDHLAMRALPDVAARNAYALSQIQARLAELGPGGLLHHTVEKLAYTWADGCYYAQYKLAIDPVRPGLLHQFVIPGGLAFPAFSLLANSFQLVYLFLLALLCWHALRTAKTPGLDWAALVSLLGVGLFLLLWETRSRYLVNILPLLLAAALQGLACLDAHLPQPGPAKTRPN